MTKKPARKPRATTTSGRRPPARAARPRSRKAGEAPPRPARSSAKSVKAVPVTADELRALQRELQRRLSDGNAGRSTSRAKTSAKPSSMRWNPDPEDVQKSVAQLVLTIVEFLRKLMERQAVRRMEARTLTDAEIEAVGLALMRLEETVRELATRFGLTPEDLNLDLGPIKLI